MASNKLIARNATQHFPATLFFKNGEITGQFNPGYETPQIFNAKLHTFLKNKHKKDNFLTGKNFIERQRLPADANSLSQIIGFKREIPLIVNPTYFIRVDTDTDKLYMSGDCIVSLSSSECVNTSRTWEPYPVAGFDLLTIPGCEKSAGMCFYDMRTFKNQNESVPILIDPNLKGYYQSVGFISRNDSEAVIRIITYYGYMRDYVVRKGYVSARGPAKKFCEGKPLLKLPMLSKNGKYISGWDDINNKTVIMSITDQGKCAEVFSFNTMVSKMDWSYDEKYVAFHMSKSVSGEVSENTSQDTLLNQNIYLMNLQTKKIKQLSSGSGFLYFPHFGRNGLIYALKRNSEATKFSVIELDPASAGLKDDQQ